MGKKSGKAGTAEAPSAPQKAQEAIVADPGKMAEIKAEKAKKEQAESGSTTIDGSTDSEETTEEPQTTFDIRIELRNDQGKAVPNEAYEVTLPDGSVRKGNLNEKGKAKIEGIEQDGECQVALPEIDADEWRKL